MYADFSSHADRSAVSKEQVSSVVNPMNALKLKYTAIVFGSRRSELMVRALEHRARCPNLSPTGGVIVLC